MRFIQVHQFGPPDVLRLEEGEEPQAGPGQVVIEVKAAGVLFGDTLLRSGKHPMPFPLPYVPGLEVAGRVIGVGSGVNQSLIGKFVVARTNNDAGGYAEQVAIDASNVFLLPQGLSIEQAIGVILSG